MNKCKRCGVFIDENLNKCPLCHRSVNKAGDGNKNGWYPVYDVVKFEPQSGFGKKIFLFILIAVISICILINILSGIRNPWFLYVACPLIYLLILVNYTILSKMHTGAKILLQTFATSCLLFLIDLLSGYSRWSVNVVIPFLFITATFLTTVIIVDKKMLWKEYVGYIFAMIFLGFLPILLYVTGVADEIWASAVSALYSLLTTIGMLLFSKKKFKNEFLRRFHF